MRHLLSFFFNRLTVLVALVLLQLVGLILLIVRLSQHVVSIYTILIMLSVVLAIYIAFQKSNPSYTMAWITVILIFPVVGGIFYLLFGNKKVPQELSRFANVFAQDNQERLKQDPTVFAELKKSDPLLAKQSYYIWKNSFYPVYDQTEVTYFPDGESKFFSMLTELRQAEKYIFLEYFIIEPGYMWNSILSILIEKAAVGVDVRVMYDDAGCINKLPANYDQYLISLGIKCQIFNRLRPRLIIQMNNRNHRKLCVIDGKKAYLGGINLADEYINQVERFGHWKDTAVLVSGAAIQSAVLMFLQFWDYKQETAETISDFYVVAPAENSLGYVQIFSDSPTDNEEVSETVHLNMINMAKDYVYIYTPYLIPSYSMIQALEIAAKNGVDVRIIVPHIPDKWYVHFVTQANYRSLLKSGVKIYEYTPGFLHGKNFVADDEVAVIGSSNMDFRSYYLHFEAGVVIYQQPVIQKIKADFLATQAESQLITLADWQKYPLRKRMIMAIISLFSYLM